MALNIDRSNNDPFYRYKMPRLVAKVEGSGNGIKTVVANISDIAKSLERPPTYPLKYFGYELGAQTMIDAKNERYIVNGSHDAVRLQEMLDGFIKKFVLCQNCNNPETTLQVKKNVIRQNCAACGHNCIADMKHKLASYIVKNPPADVGEYGEKGKAKGKGKNRKGGKEEDEKKENGKNGAKKTNGSGETPNSPSTETEEAGFTVPPPVVDDENGWDDDDWGEDSEEAQKERQKDLTNGIKHLTLNADLEKTEEERLDLFEEFVKKRKESGLVDDKEIMAEAERLEVKEKASLILATVLFDGDMLKQIPLYRKVFLRFAHGSHRAQKLLLGGFEHLVGVAHSTVLMPKCVALLKELYDRDILEEEVLLEWYDKPSKKYVRKLSIAEEIRKKAFPFIKWLKEAEAESSEEEDDDHGDAEDDIPVVSTNGGKAGDGKTMTNGKPNGLNGKAATGAGKVTNGSGSSTPPTEDDEEDVDIDAI